MATMYRVVYITAFVTLLGGAACFQLPDLADLFSSFSGKDQDVEKTKERVKRQDPGIGDESQLPYLVRAAQLPLKPGTEQINDRYMPTLGNGHLATTVYSNAMYLNGLYEGTGANSHRAKIPARIMGRIKIANPDVEGRATRKYILNAEEGYFMETIDCDFAYIEHKLYIHKHFIRLFVSDIYWRKKSGAFGGGTIKIEYPQFNSSDDITFGETTYYHGHFHNTGQTKTAEDGASPQTMHIFWMHPPGEFSIQGSDTTRNLTTVMAIDRQESNAVGEFDQALQVIESNENGHYELFNLHRQAWKNVWSKGKVEVVGDNQLAKIVMFSQYYLLSSLTTTEAYQPPQHAEFLYGVGRTSLAKGGSGKDYQGHVMWDNEMYILPALILFHPEQVKRALRYRTETGNAARQIAEAFGSKGFKYAAQSAYTGQEVSPGDCPECEFKKYYTSAVVSWLIRQYYSATRDRDYLINTDYVGCDITREIARFYADRTTYDPDTARYSMGEMTGPDDTYTNTPNNAFTLVAASLAIHWARYMACQCQRNEREEVPDEWVQMALYYDLPFDNVGRLHNMFQGFSDIANPQLKQADTILLTYPLNWNMSRDIMRHDLEYYEQVTNDISPAMTWSFFTIGWKWVEDEPKMNSFFLKSYQDYLIQPFKIWTEYNEGSPADQESGSVNFLPGMGGFLQSIIYGFAGIRIRPESLEFHHPRPPPGTTLLRLNNMQYLGANITIDIDERQVNIQVHGVGEYPLVLRRNDSTVEEESLNPGGYITIENPRDGFFIYTNQQSGCEHPRDYIYMPWGYSPFVDGAPSIHTSRYIVPLTLLFLVSQTLIILLQS